MFNLGKPFIKKPVKNQPPREDRKFENLLDKTTSQITGELANTALKAVSFSDILGLKPVDKNKENKALKAEENKEKELGDLRKNISQGPGRNVGNEMKEVADKAASEEKRKEEEFLANLRRKRELEEAEKKKALAEAPGSSKKPGKEAQKKRFAQGAKKASTSLPSQEQLSQTGEFTQKPE